MRVFIVALTLIVGFSFPALAQSGGGLPKPRYSTIDDIQKYAYRSGPAFEFMARSALNSRPPRFDFTEFRRHYAQSRQFDPIGDETIEKMMEIAYVLDTTKDPQEYKTNLNAYQNLVMDHMAHLGVVLQAASLAKKHKRYGDPELFKWLKAGLIRDVVKSGDGYSLRGAYDVITMAEETLLFNYLGMQSLKNTPNNEGVTYYNMHRAKELATGKEYTIFVNTSFAMKFLEAKNEMHRGFLYETNKDLGFRK